MKNNNLIIGVIVAIVVVVGIVAYMNNGNSQNTPAPTPSQSNPATQPTTMNTNSVTIQNMAFSPASLTVKVGDKVTWTNQDSIGHSATADDGSFDTGVLSQGKSGSATFTKAGTVAYHCSVHPSMHGTIVVQ